MGKIFINYRRSESSPQAQYLAMILRREFGNRVFIDIDNIDEFSNWLVVLKAGIHSAAILICIIDKEWEHLKDENGRIKIENEADPVRYEIEEAINLEITVLSVLLDRNDTPKKKSIPQELFGILKHQAMQLRRDHLEHDSTKIANAIRKFLKKQENKRASIPAIAMVTGLSLILGVFAGILLTSSDGGVDVQTPLPNRSAYSLISVIKIEQKARVKESRGERSSECFTEQDLNNFHNFQVTDKITRSLRQNKTFLDVVRLLKKMPAGDQEKILDEASRTYKPTWSQIGKVDPSGQTEAGQRAEKEIAEAIVTLVRELL